VSGVLEVSNLNLQYSSAATGQSPFQTQMPDDRGEELERCNGFEDGEVGKDGKGDELLGRYAEKRRPAITGLKIEVRHDSAYFSALMAPFVRY